MGRIRDRLKASPIYRRFEWSPVHRRIIRLRNPAYEAALARDADFYRGLIAPGDLVFDVGANVGSKSEVFLTLGARVVAVEPDLRCGQILRRRFPDENFTLEPSATGAAAGSLEFFSAEPGSAYNTLSRKWHEVAHGGQTRTYAVDVVTLDSLIERHGLPGFLKIDVEGYERETLLGLSTPVPAISIEANLPAFREEAIACVERLHSLCPDYRFSFYSDLTTWHDQGLTAKEARSHLQLRDGYCEIFAVCGG